MHKSSIDGARGYEASLTQAAHAMLARVSELGDMAAAETSASEPSYRELVPAEDLRRACHETVTLLLTKLAGLDTAELDGVLDDLGRRRARQGVGLDTLLRAFRIDFRIVWELLITWLETRPPKVQQYWTEFVLPLWHVVDEISVRISEVYREAEVELSDERERDVRSLFEELLYGTGPVSTVARKAASRYGLGEHGPYVVVRADRHTEPTRPEGPLRENGAHSVWSLDSDVLTGIVALEKNPQQLADCLRRVLRTRAGVSPPYLSLQDTRRQVWLADAARDSTHPASCDVVFAADDIPSLFVGGAREISDHLGATLLDGLASIKESERQRLLETLQVHLEGSGSPTETARRLYCHRNTILNRLRRFEELSGLDLTRPKDLATALLAVRSVRRLGLDSAGTSV
ncbi:PucR family transcriptional regulator [Saccharopolyspora sp. 5N708]|uniref:PucR family transcriptional regulator n=1 Tax=Saccharopolyspora sp. 5N708 TaxID=3457424 RepID=UPI003FCF160C